MLFQVTYDLGKLHDKLHIKLYCINIKQVVYQARLLQGIITQCTTQAKIAYNTGFAPPIQEKL